MGLLLMVIVETLSVNGHCGDSLSHAHTLKSREDEGSKLAHEVKFFLVLGFRDSGSLES